MASNIKEKKSFYAKLVEKMERVGNKLPSPFIMFMYLTAAIIVIIAILGIIGVHITDPSNGQTIYIKSLFSKEGLGWFFPNFIKNIMDYSPFGLVLLLTVAVTLADQVGFFPVLIKRSLLKVPPFLLTIVVITLAILFNFASDAAIVVVPPLAGLIFYMVGRNPIVGILAGYAAAAGGFGANLIVTSYDALLFPLTNSAAATVSGSNVEPMTMVSNWYFFAASAVILIITATFITIKFIEPRFKNIECDNADKTLLQQKTLTSIEKKGLRNVLISVIIFLAIILLLILPKNGLLRGADGGIIQSPFMDGIPFIIFAFFVMIAIVYGVTTKYIKKVEDIPIMTGEAVASLKSFIASVFIIGQLIAIFNWSNLGKVIGLACYYLAMAIGLNGIWLLFALIIITMITSIFISSASALWSMFAPMFVPMLMLLGFSPAVIQVAFRIGSPLLTIVSPFMVYIPMIMGYIGKYTKKFNLGLLLSAMFPYTIAFTIVWILQLVLWIIFNLPLGPNSFIYLS